jgi:hypothetical protein
MGLLEGQDILLLRGDVEELKEEVTKQIMAVANEHDTIYTNINMMREQMRYIESFIESVNRRLLTAENTLKQELGHIQNEKEGNNND